MSDEPNGNDQKNGKDVSDPEWEEWLKRNRKPRDVLAADYERQEEEVLSRARVNRRSATDMADLWNQFLITLATNGGVVMRACRVHSVTVMQYRKRCEDDADWALMAAKAIDMGTEMLEEEIHRRAVDGVLEPVMYQGEVVGHIRRYSDTLLMFMLKARRPGKYKDTIRSELTGPDGQPLPSQNNNVMMSNVMDLLREAADRRAEKHVPQQLEGRVEPMKE